MSLIGAVEAGGTKFVLALADEAGGIRAHARIPTETPDVTMRAMADFFRAGQAKHGSIGAFGIGSFGPINEGFTPSADEVAFARRVVAAFEADPNAGTVGIDGKMFDIPHLKSARRTLAAAGEA